MTPPSIGKKNIVRTIS